MILMDRHLPRPHLLIIPGLGDRAWLYRAVVPLWRYLEYDVSLHAFDWNGRQEDLADRQKRLIKHVDSLASERLFVIGASAGGVAAVNLLAERPHLQRVVTVASPLTPRNISLNALFLAALNQAGEFLDGSNDLTRRKVVSIHGRRDSRVPVELSRCSGIHDVELPTYGHGPTISSALTVRSAVLRRFLI
ncbi:alpha/beta fold hydrolase [Amycolatopsis azurea]|uniref:alpha/beta fold hydrolase n=1 Tax=Amycolatopsis azurea TaxID=36819 RepID=UPI0038136527